MSHVADGVLVVLDATLGLCTMPQIQRHLAQAALQPLREGVECVLMLNILDLLLSQEPSLPKCHKALRKLVRAVGDASGAQMDPAGAARLPNVVFGRGSFDNGRRKQREKNLPVTAGEGGWGFTLPTFAQDVARRNTAAGTAAAAADNAPADNGPAECAAAVDTQHFLRRGEITLTP